MPCFGSRWKYFVTRSEDSTVRVWDLANKRHKACLIFHKASIGCVSISSDCCFALSGSKDKTVILWDIKKM